ncbi:MAG TPA: hypothetical protein VKU82_10415 [Planctomycetaceae bacterium]|nr:hypothetical protein [Planctomycetaceae bacterium]
MMLAFSQFAMRLPRPARILVGTLVLIVCLGGLSLAFLWLWRFGRLPAPVGIQQRTMRDGSTAAMIRDT